ncbi:MAG: MFS transporter [Corynebacterium sp.]|nr:MFS transporter [Corynebacterium sp.]
MIIKPIDATPRIPQEIWILVSAAFLVALGYGLVSPILPQLAHSFDVSVAAVGFVVSVMSFARLVFAPPAGHLVNKLGSRAVYITGLLIVAVGTGAVSIAQAYWQILALRLVSGIGSTMFTVSALSLIVKISPPEIRGRCSSTYGTAFLVGNICGPLLGTVLSPLGMRIPFVIYAVALLAASTVVFLRLRPSALKHSAEATKPSNLPPLQLKDVISDSAYRAVMISSFFHGFSNMGVRVAILPLFAAHVFGNHGTALAGLALSAFALGNACSLQFSGRLADKIGRRPLIIAGLIFAGTFTLLMGFMTTKWAVLLLSVLAGAGAGIMVPAQQAAMADIIGKERPGGTVMATQQMAQDCGVVLGPIVVGFIADHWGYGPGFMLAGIVLYLGIILWINGRETLPSRNPAPSL